MTPHDQAVKKAKEMFDKLCLDDECHTNHNHFTPYYLEIAVAEALESHMVRIQELEEQRIIELGAISTASIKNTESSAKERIEKANPYWTGAYYDVCVAIDREMQLIKENSSLKESLKGVAAALEPFAKEYEESMNVEAIMHYRADWSKFAMAKSILKGIKSKFQDLFSEGEK